jgi:sugar lactone lactonase YvrE
MKKCTILSLVLALLLVCGIQNANAQRITVTLAGDATAGYNGDGNAGVTARISAPYDVCSDAAHNVYFTDMGNGRVRKIWASNGMVTTVAGGGTSTADGIPAQQAVIVPRNMCIDAKGNLFVVDSASNRIRRIDAVTNIITTVAGTGGAGFSGDGGLAVSATFNSIYGICLDIPGNLYLVDQGNNRVRRIDATTGIINTIAGTGVSGLSGDGAPALSAMLSTTQGICVSPTKDVYIADQTAGYATRIRKIDASTGIISTIAGGTMGGSVLDVPLMSAWLGDVTGMCMDKDGNFYCNEISCSCRKMDMKSDSIYAVGGNFGIESFSDGYNSNLSYMNNPYGICSDAAANVYVADLVNNRIRKLIQLTHTPSFAYGEGQLMNVCSEGSTVSINQQMAITDLDPAQPETWTILSGPVNGTLSGFPYTAASNGTDSLTIPTGLSYTAGIGFAGTDMFKVMVTDGALTDIVTIYVSVGNPAAIISPVSTGSSICAGSTENFTDAIPGGMWNVTNDNAAISVSGLVSGISPGTDTIVYNISNSCGTASASRVITVNDCISMTLGNNTVNTVQGLSIFPNPASSVLNIKWSNWDLQNMVTIADVTGREMSRNEFAGNGATSMQVDVSSLPSGVYIVKVNSTEVRKFVKE